MAKQPTHYSSRLGTMPTVAPPSTYASPGAYWSPAAMNLPPVEYPMPVGAVANGGNDIARPGSNSPMVLGNRMKMQRDAEQAARAQAQSAAAQNALRWGGNRPVGGSTWGTAGPGPAMGAGPTPGVPMGMSGGGYVSPGGGGAQGSGTYAGGGATGSLGGSFQQAMDRANQANEARYQDVLGGYQSRYQRAMDTLDGMGSQEARDINERYRSQESQRRQQLIGRGLGNSTVVNTMQMGNERERLNDMGRLQERLRGQYLSTDAGLTGDTLQFMERKTENGPSYELLARLSQGMGAAGYGAPAGLGGGGGYMGPSVDTWGGGFGMNPYAFMSMGGGFPKDTTHGAANFVRQFGKQAYADKRAGYNATHGDVIDPEYAAWAGGSPRSLGTLQAAESYNWPYVA
jgi:hypothetical protein